MLLDFASQEFRPDPAGVACLSSMTLKTSPGTLEGWDMEPFEDLFPPTLGG
jgi:hypothetical protein